ncbi:hypothetical protein Dimus_007202 [Dionaea muscipula]
MPPRRRRKVGLKRIDAAIDACTPMGFSPDFVRSKVKELLDVYGGDEGWVFIEEASYKILIETMLEEQEKQRCEVGFVPLQEDGCPRDEVTQQDNAEQPGPSSTGTSKAQDAGVASIEAGGKLVCTDEDSDLANLDPVDVLPLPPPRAKNHGANNPAVPKRRPQLGWISRGNDCGDNFVLLTPYPIGNQRADHNNQPRQRRVSTTRSRWDLKPE